jgi:hypothetical protein
MYAKRNKKIILRFLKELGLLHAWQSYVKTKRYKQILEIHKKGLYEEKYIDRIFGRSDFTFFLREKYGFKIHSSISNIFRFYVLETSIINQKELFACETGKANLDVTIDKKTNAIKFINNYDEK